MQILFRVFSFTCATFLVATDACWAELGQVQRQLTDSYNATVPAFVRIAMGLDGKREQTQGIIISPEGLVAVHDGANRMRWQGPISVTVSSGKELPARALGWSEEWRIGLIQIDTDENLPFVELSTATNLPVGELCFALDYSDSFGLGADETPTMRLGFVTSSGVGWFKSSCEFGNLGGLGAANFDSRGKLIGITTRRKSSAQEIQTDAYAIRKNLLGIRQIGSLDAQQLKKSVRPPVLPNDGKSNFEIAKAASVRIRHGDNPARNFSGTVVNAAGLIMSCAHHELGEGAQVLVEFSDGKNGQGMIIGTNPISDICLIQLNGTGPWPHALVGDSFSLGFDAPLTILGYPSGGQSRNANLKHTVVVDIEGYSESSLLRTARGAIKGGMSGGGVFDEYGRLIAVHTGRDRDSGFQVRIEAFFKQWDAISRASNTPNSKATDRSEVEEAFRRIASSVAPGVAEIWHKQNRVAYGIVVSSNGKVVTKASEMIAPLTCRFANGDMLPATIVKVSREQDLALLSVDAKAIQTVELSPSKQISPTCLAAAVLAEAQAVVGVVAHSVNQVANDEGVLPFTLNAIEDSPNGIRVVNDEWIQMVEAPLKKGDEVIGFSSNVFAAKSQWEKLDKRSVFRVKGTAGDPIKLLVRRGEQELTIRMPLFPTAFPGLAETSARSSGFPAAFDIALRTFPTDCGAPLLDIEGRCIGILAARRTRGRIYVVPSDVIIEFCSPSE